MIYPDTLPKKTTQLIEKIKSLPELDGFYLSGGTALSLQLGHRESEDLDFFSKQEFEPEKMQQALIKIGLPSDIKFDIGTLGMFLDEVKLEFLHYPYSVLEDFVEWNGLKLSSVIDIACTKLITISARGSKKDFIDLYQILQTHTLHELFQKLDEKYAGISYNHIHIMQSLLFFEDAEIQPMPRMHIDVSWDDVKKTISKEVKALKL